MADPQAELTLWKRSLGRDKGQPPARLDCSGNAGMVTSGDDGAGRKVWIVAGSGSGGTGSAGRRGKRVRKMISGSEKWVFG